MFDVLRRRREKRAREIDLELQAHFEARVDDLIARGFTPGEARAEATRRFGDLEGGRRAIQREAVSRFGPRGAGDAVHDVLQDLRYVARGLLRSKALTLGVVTTIAIGLGVNAAVFRVADFVLLRPPSGVADPRAVRRVETSITIGHGAPMKATAYSYRDAGRIVSSGAFKAAALFVMRQGRDAAGRDVTVGYVDDAFFRTLGIQPAEGRGFTREEGTAGRKLAAAVVSADYWQRALGSAPLAESSGAPLQAVINTRAYPVVGILPAGFTGIDLDPVDVWLPMGVGEFGYGTINGVTIPWYETEMMRAIRVVGRLPDNSTEAVTADRLSAALKATLQDPDDVVRRAVLKPIVPMGGTALTAESQSLLTELSVVAGIVLLIACANAVNLLLARGLRRRQEIAIRMAIGASRSRVSRLLLFESLMLAVLGGGAAVGSAIWTAESLRRLLFPDARWIASAADHRTLVFLAVVTLVAGLVAGFVPALQATSPDLVTGLKQQRTAGGSHTSLTRRALIVVQTALSLTLLVSAGLLVRSLVSLNRVPMGFAPAGLVTASFDSSGFNRNEPAPGLQAAELAARLAGPEGSMPSVSLSSSVPFGVMAVRDTKVIGSSFKPDDRNGPRWAAVDTSYFSALKTRVVDGRPFGPEDGAGAEPVALINQSMARAYFNGTVPPGACVQGSGFACARIIGVVEDIRDTPNGGDPPMRYYLPLAQSGTLPLGVTIRTTVDQARDVAARVRAIIPSGQRVTVEVIQDRVDRALRPWRTATWLFGALGVLALVLACLGVYSVMSYVTSERTHELGLRVILGATSGDILRLVLGGGLRMTLAGALVGVIAAGLVGRYLGALLFGVSAFDPVTYIAGVICLILTTLAAILSPALRASRVDPVAALRAD